MPTKRTIARDFHDLLKNIKSFSDGQAAVTKWDDKNIGTFEVTISPNEGCYKEGEFVFEIVMNTFDILPRLKCKTAIHHPNINTITDPAGQICINLFDPDMWASSSSMQDIVQGLLFLMHNPNLEDPLHYMYMMAFSNMEEFRRNVKKSIAGRRVGNYQFPVNARYKWLHPHRTRVDDKGDMEDVEDRYFGIKEYIPVHVGDEEDNFDISHFFSESDGSDSSNSSSEKVYRPASSRVDDKEKYSNENCLDFLNESDYENFDDYFSDEFDSCDSDSNCSFDEEPPSTRVPVLQRAQSTPVGLNHAQETCALRRCNSVP